ncbi:F0F1 ATP synthase subunit delta, partial [Salmonella enterica subsp. enterica serovar Kottbus]|nr:F0F1 ATP synthase subunit delta [Salmonella enterica subsp. enterica serovar Kottbus]
MAQSSSPVSAVAERYARSLYELASDSKSVASVEADLASFANMLASSPDLDRLIKSPVFSTEDQVKAIDSIAAKAKFGKLVANFLRVVAGNRRLFAVPGMITAFHRIAAEARGETAADVVSAHALTAAQQTELKAALKGVTGKDVTINVTVDPSLLGGLIVKLGSRQIDT